MMNLISWTGWTKEDWIDALKFGGQVLVNFVFMYTVMFCIGYFG